MDAVSRPVTIAGFPQGQARRSPKPGEGSHYEECSFIDDATGRADTYNLDGSVNGERPKAQTKARLVLRHYKRDCVRERRDGSTYRTTLVEPVVVGFEAA